MYADGTMLGGAHHEAESIQIGIADPVAAVAVIAADGRHRLSTPKGKSLMKMNEPVTQVEIDQRVYDLYDE